MKTINFFRLGAVSALLILFVSFTNGQERPGIECSCTKTGQYVAPGIKKILVEAEAPAHEGSSSKGKYKLFAVDATDVAPDAVNITIKYNDTDIFNETISATGWGFSPDEDRFVMFGLSQGAFWVRLVNLNPDSDKEGEPAIIVTEENLISSSGLTSSNIVFSPHGKYLLYAGIDNGGRLMLRVFYSKTGALVYDGSGPLAIYASGKSVAGWGFSPDSKDATFVHAYLTTANKYSVRARKLMAASSVEVMASDNNQGEARFLFSPCGDYFAWIYSTTTGFKASLFRTIEKTASPEKECNAETFKYFASYADKHYIVNSATDSLPLADNRADNTCTDVEKPLWKDDMVLDTGLVEGVNMELHWEGDSDNVEVTAYRIYKKDDGLYKLYKEIEAVRKVTVTELNPDTEYNFKIEAGDEAGNWSTTGPDSTFSTLTDDPPTWPLNSEIIPSGITETKITLTWNAASDDYGIESYKIYKILVADTIEVNAVNGDVLKYQFKGLKAATEYTFSVEACDAADHWITGPKLIKTMPAAECPTWPPVGAALRDSAITETSLIVKWPLANDNFIAVTGYKIIMNGDTIASTTYNPREYLVNGLVEGTIYQFEVIAIDESGGKSPPLTASFSTLSSYIVDPLIKANGNQKRPDIDGKMVVWWDDSRDYVGDIYSYDLETDSLRQVTNNPHAQFDPTVSGDRIVWTDSRNGSVDIYMYDPVLGEVPICTAPGLQDQPAIDGDIIVWRDSRNGNSDIYMYDIKTGTESPVITRKSHQYWPDVSGNYIVYADDRNGNWDIYMYGIYEKKETAVCTDSYDQTYPVVTGKWLSDLAVAYMDDRNGKNIYIYYPDFLMGQEYEYLVPLDIYPAISPQTYPHLEDKQLVFQDPLGGAGTDFNIYAFQFNKWSETSGSKKEICVDPIIKANQTRPRTSQGNIVWQDERNGNSDIYIWRRPPFSDLQLSVKEITDPIKVGDTLKYIVTVKNDGPRMNTSILTECSLPLMAEFDTVTVDKGTVNFGRTVIWDIDTLRNGCSANLEIVMVTFDLVLLELKVSTGGKAFDPDPSDNEITVTTKVKEFVPGFVSAGSDPSMQVEQDGRVHLVYFSNSNLMYATSARKGRWEYKSLGPCVGCLENDMVLDKDSNVQIVTYDRIYDPNTSYGESRLYHGTLTKDGQWSKKIIALSDSGFHSISLKADSHNELHLVYQNAPGGAYPGNLKEMRTVGGQWIRPVVFSEAYDHIDMTIDKDDNLQASYYVVDTGPVYQKKNSSGNGSWNESEVVEPGWDGLGEGMIISIATDDYQIPHIFYQGGVASDGGTQKHAWKTNDKWNIETIDEKYSSPGQIVIDPGSIVNLSYIWSQPVEYGKYSAEHVRYATNIAGQWITEEVDEDTKRWGTSKAIDMGRDNDKYTHIAYVGGHDSVLYALIPPIKYFEVNPDILDFGAIEPGLEETLVLKLTNPMSENIRIDSIVIADERISMDQTTFILYRYSSESVNVSFKQTEAPWTNTHLRIWYNSPSGLFMDIPVRAKSRQPELISDQDPVDFNAVPLNTLVIKTVTLQNSGATNLIISGITVNATPADFKLVGYNCSTLQPGQTCDVQISFKPTKNGSQQSYLNISSNDPVTPNKKITIKGKSANPQIYCQSSIVYFGYCLTGQSVTKTITIKNTGEQALNITSATLSGTYMSQFSLSNSCSSIAPGDSCIMQLTMTPTMLADLQATLSIKSNSLYSSTLTVILKGSSLLRTLGLSTTLLSFGNVHIGEQSQKLLELQNTGSASITVTGIQTEGNDYCEFSPNSGYITIAAGANYIITVSFIPQFEGEKTANLVITSNDSYKPVQAVVLTGQAGSMLPLQARISADPDAGPEPLEVTFHASVTGGQPPYIYKWDFDDMKISERESPVHEFTGPGVYNISLKVSDVIGNSTTASIKVGVTAEGVPVVIAGAQPNRGEIPLNVQFNTIVTGGDAPLSFLWEFRDGSTSTLQNPMHNFTAPGSYMARITVTDNDGDKCKDSVLVTAIWNNSLAGQIWDETGTNHINKSKVVLYPQSNINDTILLVLNGSYSYLFPGLPGANYTVLAIPDTIVFPGDLPTYLGDKISLYEASWVLATGLITGKDIRLIKKPESSSGSGIISGNLVKDSGKGLKITEKTSMLNRDPVTKVFVYLKSVSDGKLKAWDITSSDGSFSFKGLENGSYYFVADYQGKPMDNTNTPLVISDTKNNLEILAIVGTDKITVQDLTTGIADEKIPGIKVYPVPARDHIVVEIPEEMFNANSVRIKILDLSGKYVFIDEKYDLSGNPATLSIDFLNDGMYLLEVADNNKSHKVKIVKMR